MSDVWQKDDIWTSSRKDERKNKGTRKYSYRPYDVLDPKEKRLDPVYRTSTDTVWNSKEKEYPVYERRRLKVGVRPSQKYAMETPYPTYAQFKTPEMIDVQCRQYRWADGTDFRALKEEMGDRLIEKIEDIVDFTRNTTIQASFDKQALFYLRFNKGDRQRIYFPELGDSLLFMNIKNGAVIEGKVEIINGSKNIRGATGSIVVSKLKFHGFANDSEFYKSKFLEALKKLPKKYKRLKLK